MRMSSTATCLPFANYLRMLSAIVVVLSLSEKCFAQRNPVTNFCRRFGHQTAVIDRKLYIDGGFINWNPLPSDPTNYTNTWLAYQDLDHPGNAGMPQLSANLSKNASIPSVNGGALWADDVNKKFYLFGGEYYQEQPNDFTLYAYDVLENYWETVGSAPDDLYAVSYGASVSISATGEAYYYGGWISNNSQPGWTGSRTATNGLVKYTMDSMVWSNNTGPDNIGRAEGAMVYIPASDGGMLVYFGGVQDQGNGSVVGQPMEQMGKHISPQSPSNSRLTCGRFVYDILSSRWYQQTASGNIPQMRSRFCAGATWAPDQSSYNIYLYGGRGMPPSTAGFDDVYILSLPSFTWIKFYPEAANTNQYPHNTLSCNVIDNAQMIIIGGTFPLDDTTCDNPEQWGSHNLDLGKQNPQGAQWYLYQANVTSYVVPQEIIDAIGGGPQGGATKRAPDGGFDQPDLSVYLRRTFTAATRTPTRSIPGETGTPSGPALSSGAIAGIAVGSAAALMMVLVGCCWFIRRHRRRYYQKQPGTPGSMPHTYTSDMGGDWTPYSSPSHRTPVSPYEPSSFPRHPDNIPPIPAQPVELDGVPREAPVEVPGSPHSTEGGNKNDHGSWPSSHPTSPVHDIGPSPTMTPARPASDVRYASAGFGPSELGTDTETTGATESSRHETFYHP
ncbi:hypothetical protein F5X96DRAFT_678949 [Biscogniauxia mediterranea]|nr:hypothetical protein F5X96DRAFT_678949 [Biscogniauxia mediterranea]